MLANCPFDPIARCQCHIPAGEHESCARYQAGIALGAVALPDDLGVIDYGRIPTLINERENNNGN